MKFFLRLIKPILLTLAGVVFGFAQNAMATQAHGAPEGIYAHQLSHFFFLFSMVILIYWLRQRNLVQELGWKYIQYAALFFILWNANVILVHFLDEQAALVVVEKINPSLIKVSSPLGKWVEILYCFAKMDHLLSVPALMFLFLGLRRLLTKSIEASEAPGQ